MRQPREMDMRFPYTFTEEDVTRNRKAARLLAVEMDRVRGDERNAYPPDSTFLHLFDPASKDALKIQYFQGLSEEDKAIVVRPIDFTALSWIQWAKWRIPPEPSQVWRDMAPLIVEEDARMYRETVSLRLSGWLDWFIHQPAAGMSELREEWRGRVQIDYYPHLAKGRLTLKEQRREWIIPFAPEMAEYMAALIDPTTYPNLPNRGAMKNRSRSQQFLDLAVGYINVVVPSLADFDAWEKRYVDGGPWAKVVLK